LNSGVCVFLFAISDRLSRHAIHLNNWSKFSRPPLPRSQGHDKTSLLYEAATVILTRSLADSDLRTWGLKLKGRIGFKRAAVAVARKLAVIMHAMLRDDTPFVRVAKAAT
jgi:transposase